MVEGDIQTKQMIQSNSMDSSKDEDWETEEGPVRGYENQKDLEGDVFEDPVIRVKNKHWAKEEGAIRKFEGFSKENDSGVDIFIKDESGESSLTISD